MIILIFVFLSQILTQEDWNIIMYDGMAKTSPWAALYFVALMTIGNYVLFNLLVAILVEGFSSVVCIICQFHHFQAAINTLPSQYYLMLFVTPSY